MFSSFKKNPFKDSVRLFDIDFGCNQSYYTQMRIKLADNFSVESMPKNMTIRMEDSSISFERSFFADEKYLLIRNSFVIRESVFSKDDYPALKSFFDKIYALLNEELLLKKKE
jgi:activator of HSP90 ATPase